MLFVFERNLAETELSKTELNTHLFIHQ